MEKEQLEMLSSQFTMELARYSDEVAKTIVDEAKSPSDAFTHVSFAITLLAMQSASMELVKAAYLLKAVAAAYSGTTLMDQFIKHGLSED